MATDATGTPTSPDSIPTYNTSVDAPSGLGFNAAMAAIQTALSARVSKPTGIADGEIPVWDADTNSWVRSSAHAVRVGTSGLLIGPDGTNLYHGGSGIVKTDNQLHVVDDLYAGWQGSDYVLHADTAGVVNVNGNLVVDGTITGSGVGGSITALGTFTGKNNASFTQITLDALIWDDFSPDLINTTNNYLTVPEPGIYEIHVYGNMTGQSGTGGGGILIDHQNSSGVLTERIGDQRMGLNEGATASGAAFFGTNERIAIQTQNGATGTAGTMAGRVYVVKVG